MCAIANHVALAVGISCTTWCTTQSLITVVAVGVGVVADDVAHLTVGVFNTLRSHRRQRPGWPWRSWPGAIAHWSLWFTSAFVLVAVTENLVPCVAVEDSPVFETRLQVRPMSGKLGIRDSVVVEELENFVVDHPPLLP